MIILGIPLYLSLYIIHISIFIYFILYNIFMCRPWVISLALHLFILYSVFFIISRMQRSLNYLA